MGIQRDQTVLWRGRAWPTARAHVAVFASVLTALLMLTGCGSTTPKPDARLTYFQVVSSRILIDGNQAQVRGNVMNNSTMTFPFDVTMQATLMDISGHTVGTASGVAEDVGPGQLREFALVGTVDGSRYAKLVVVPVSLQEKQSELGMPTPTPLGS